MRRQILSRTVAPPPEHASARQRRGGRRFATDLVAGALALGSAGSLLGLIVPAIGGPVLGSVVGGMVGAGISAMADHFQS